MIPLTLIGLGFASVKSYQRGGQLLQSHEAMGLQGVERLEQLQMYVGY